MRNSKRGLLSGKNIFFLIGICVILIALFSVFSSAILSEDKYALDEKVKIDLQGINDYRLKITTPSTTYVMQGSDEIFVFKPDEIGRYILNLQYQEESEIYEFEVVDSQEGPVGETEEGVVEEPEKPEGILEVKEKSIGDDVLFEEKASEKEEKPESGKIRASEDEIVINRPVKWQEVVSIPEGEESARLRIPGGSTNVSVSLVSDGQKEKLEAGVEKEPFFNYALRIFQGDSERRSYVVLENVHGEIELTYETPGPFIEENRLSDAEKEVIVSSLDHLHYENVLSYTDIPEITGKKELVKIYWKEEDRYLDFEAFDEDSDGLLDRVEWVIPHLSQQTFVISISVLNVQSYPVVGGNWNVDFVTEGKADLYIRGFNGTLFNEDLVFLELRCGAESIEYVETENGIFVENYECSEASSEFSKVLTEGKHALEFEFGGERAYAFNEASPYQIIGEWGQTTDVPDSWTRVNFNHTFNTTPVVVHYPEYDYSYDDNPCSTRIRNVNLTGFDIRSESWDAGAFDDDCPSTGLNAYWLAMEQGTHVVSDGGSARRTVEVSNFTMSSSACGEDNDWTHAANQINFQNSWTNQPIVLTSVQTAVDDDLITWYIHGCGAQTTTWDNSCVEIGLNGMENDGSVDACALHTSDEEGGYIAWEMDNDWTDAESRDNNGTFGNSLNNYYWEAFWESDNVQGTENDASPLSSYFVTLSQTYNAGAVFGSGIRIDGGNGLFPVIDFDSGSNQVFFAADEDEFEDDDQSHTAEPWQVLFFNASSGFVYSNVSNPPPQITNVNATSITDSSATIEWETNELSNSSVDYGTTLSLGSSNGDSDLVLNHSVLISGLSATTLYYYNVTSCSGPLLCNATGPFNFTTITGTPPTVFNITPVNNSDVANPVTLSASTSETATCEYSTTQTFVYGTGTDFSTTGGTFHTTSLGNLAGGSHVYYIKCEDTASNANDDSNQGVTSFNVDAEFPVVTLNQPNSGEIDLEPDTSFNWTVSDNLASSLSCDWYLDDSLQEQGISVSNGSSISRSLTLAYSPFNWTVSCSDEVGNNINETSWFFFGQVSSAKIGEVGKISANASNWTEVTFVNSFTTPVIVTGYEFPFDNTVPPVSVRMRNVSSSGFEVILQLANSTASPSDIGDLNVTYLVVEQGQHFMQDGTRIEAYRHDTNTVSSSGNGWTSADSKTYNHTYSVSPVVFHQVMTYNDANWIATFASEDGDADNPPTTSGFQLSLNGAEGFDSHGTETIGYVVIEIANGTNGASLYESQISGDIVEGVSNDVSCTSYSVNFDNSYSSAPFVIESIQSMDGTNGGWGQTCSISTTDVNLRVEEDQLNDDERSHITEDIAIFAFDSSGTILSNTTLDVPQITDVNATTVTDSSAVIEWNTDISANSTVYYGLSNDSYSVGSEASFVLNHSVTITSLLEGTTYFYDVESCSETTGTCNVSGTFNFTTGVGEPPLIFNITPVNASVIGNPVTLSASTSETATCEYSTTQTFVYGTGTDFSTTGGAFHTTSLGSLPEATHTYYIKCEDTASNANDNSNQGSTTFSVDVNPPSIILNSPADQANVGNEVTFNWTAIDAIDPLLSCDLTVNGGSQESNISSSSGQSITTMHLFADGAYSWNITCADDIGNTNTSETRQFTIGALINVNVTTDEIQYNQGDNGNVSVNTTDLLNNPLESNVTTDIILGTSIDNSTIWWNSSWPYRQAYRVRENSGDMLQEYQINLTLDTFNLINSSKMNNACNDIRVVDDQRRLLDFYVQNSSHNGCNTTRTQIWTQLNSLVANESTVIYVYYGNNESSSESNVFKTFNYTGFENLYYVVSDDITNVDVVSFIDGNNVSNGSSYVSLDRGDITSFSVNQTSIIQATGPIFAAGDENAVDALNPISFAGTEFVYAVNRYNDIWHVYSPYGDADVCIYDGEDGSGWTLVGSCFSVNQSGAVTVTRNIGGTSSTTDETNTDTALVNSSLPVLVMHNTDNPNDAFPLYPASSDWWGVPSTRMLIGVLEDNTNIRTYYSDGTNINYSRDHGDDIYLEGFSTGGQGVAIRVVSDKPIGTVQQADQDGSEITTFLPERELDTEYFIPQTASYIAVAATYPNTNCTLYDDTDSVLSSSLTGANSRPLPNKWFYGPNHNGNNIPAGSRLSCDQPVYAYYEQFGDGGDDDERNIFGIKSSRKGALIEPDISEKGDEEFFVERNISITDANGIHSFIFDTTSQTVGNYTAITLAEASGFDDGNGQTFFELLEGINATAPNVILTNPAFNTYQSTPSISLFYNVTDINDNIANSTLVLNGGLNQTNQTTILPGEINNFTLTLPDGVYNWTVNVTDTTNLVGTDSSIRNFTIDTQAPTISLHNPLAGESLSQGVVEFNLTVSDSIDPVLVCDLIVDSNVEEDDFSSQSGIPFNITKSFGAGFHLWNVTCIDDSTNTVTSETRNFTITEEPPVVILNTTNNTYTTTGDITLAYNVTDNNAISETRLIINDQVNQTNQTSILNGEINNFSITSFSEGVYLWTVNATDTAGLNATGSPERTFTVDLNDPVVNLNLPVDNHVSNSSTSNFNFSVTDTIDSALNCDLYVGDQSDLAFSANNGTLVNREITGLTDGQKIWNVTCVDDSERSGFSGNRFINITEKPVIQLNTANNSFYNVSSFNLGYTPSDNTGLSSCNLYVDSVFNQTNQSSIISGQQYNFSLVGISEGQHDWYVSCNDTINLQNQSETRIFTVDLNGLTVELLYPFNGSEIFSDTVEFSYNATDNIDPTLSCDINVNSLVEDTFTASSGTITNRTVVFSEGGFKLWNVTCTDDSSNTITSDTWNLTLAFAPVVTLNSPSNNTFSNNASIDLFYDAQDDNNNLANATLVLNDQLNQTNQSTLINEATNNFTVTLPDGVYNWTVNVTDTTNLVGTDTSFRIFTIDTTPPNIALNSPENNSIESWNNYTINFTTLDNLDSLLQCDVYVNGNINVTLNATSGSDTITSNVLPDGNYLWNVTCIDDSNNAGWSDIYNFTIEAPPNVSLINPAQSFVSNVSSIDFQYFVDDPIGITNCSLFINDTIVDFTEEPSVGATNTFTVNNIGNGHHNWTVECIDADPDFNAFSPSARNFSVDTISPTINLISPLNNTNVLKTSDFNFTVIDNLDLDISCDLYTDGVLNLTNISVANGTSSFNTIGEFSLGQHNWNVTCADDATNANWSETWDFNVTLTDLMVNSSSIVFNNTNPSENETVQINATVHNLINVSVENVIVQFYDGDPDSSGVQIGSNQIISSISPLSQEVASVNWNADLGTSDIFVVVDPPLATNGAIEEWDESNNEVNKSITTGAWHFVFGDIESASEFRLETPSNSSIVRWDAANFESGNLYVADSESTIMWLELQAIGRDASDSATSNDFSEIDSALEMTGFVDSITNIYTNGSGTINNVSSYIVFNSVIDQVPIANSTNNTNFFTGILWDVSDDSNSEYDSTDAEDLVFIASLNKDQVGAYGLYDYEIRIPVKLREYKDTESRKVVFYSELS